MSIVVGGAAVTFKGITRYGAAGYTMARGHEETADAFSIKISFDDPNGSWTGEFDYAACKGAWVALDEKTLPDAETEENLNRVALGVANAARRTKISADSVALLEHVTPEHRTTFVGLLIDELSLVFCMKCGSKLLAEGEKPGSFFSKACAACGERR